MHYETGIRLDRIEYKLDLLLEAANATPKTDEPKERKKKVKEDL